MNYCSAENLNNWNVADGYDGVSPAQFQFVSPDLGFSYCSMVSNNMPSNNDSDLETLWDIQKVDNPWVIETVRAIQNPTPEETTLFSTDDFSALMQGIRDNAYVVSTTLFILIAVGIAITLTVKIVRDMLNGTGMKGL